MSSPDSATHHAVDETCDTQGSPPPAPYPGAPLEVAANATTGHTPCFTSDASPPPPLSFAAEDCNGLEALRTRDDPGAAPRGAPFDSCPDAARACRVRGAHHRGA